jgi:O-antigen/teichoic acid export membrane protein
MESTPVTSPPQDAGARRKLVMQGLTWSATYKIIETSASFVAMLLLARLIAPSEYGRAAAAVGLLSFVNSFGAHLIIGHALQLSDREEPDWSMYWSLTGYFQVTLFLCCHLLAVICRSWPQYAPVAPLLHIAAFGTLLDWPGQIGMAMLTRDLNFRRLKSVTAVSVMTKLATTIALAVGGMGAYAIVIGGNVMTALPPAADLLIVRGWRPRRGWLRVPGLGAAHATLHFGGQRLLGTLAATARSALEAAVLPAAVGFGGLGLWNRAQALYGSTAGRVTDVVMETVYPFLPRSRDDGPQFERHATAFLQVMALLATSGALFMGFEGRIASRVLYGSRWTAMDPLIWPGVVVGLSTTIFGACSIVLLAHGDLRKCVVLDGVAALLAVPAITFALSTHGTLEYGIALAGCETLAMLVAVWNVVRILGSRWLRPVFAPAATAGLAGSAGILLVRLFASGLPGMPRTIVMAAVFFVAELTALALWHSAVLGRLIDLTGLAAPVARWLSRRGERLATRLMEPELVSKTPGPVV